MTPRNARIRPVSVRFLRRAASGASTAVSTARNPGTTPNCGAGACIRGAGSLTRFQVPGSGFEPRILNLEPRTSNPELGTWNFGTRNLLLPPRDYPNQSG